MTTTEAEWTEGSPPSDQYQCVYWFKMHDMGGWPFVEVAHVRGEFEPHETFDPMHPPPLVAWVRIPGLGVDKLLSEVWNIDGHSLLTKPTT